MMRWIAGLLLLAGSAWAVPARDGLFATLETTRGNICFELFYTNAPRTVANFVSLAEGSRPWLDPRTGAIEQTPYYDGLLFHRVIDGFMIQCGSPKGDGTDGPGYLFSDEFDPTLRHDQPGTVSMANSGANRNGGQFFITVTNTPWLNDVHTVFGRVVEGLDVVEAISNVAVVNDRPLVDVGILRVGITRNGAAAQAFAPQSVIPPLPEVRPVATRIYRTGDAKTILDWSEHPDCAYWIFGSEALSVGMQDLVGTYVLWASADASSIAASYPRYFFRVTEVLYYE
jgi:cyclophilin family peptidyl-prolyl cis-trans isomerase